MSLDNIQLTPFLVQNLYTKTLVELNNVQEALSEKKASRIPSLGQNARNILILVNEKNAPFVSDDDLKLLVGILTACKLSLADVALVNFSKNPTLTYDQLMEYFNPGFVILFGVLPKDLSFPLHFPSYQLQQYNNQTFLCAPSLKMLGAVTEEKKQLWNSLQKHFFKP